MTLGNKLSQLRKEHNYTQEQLAQILGVSRPAGKRRFLCLPYHHPQPQSSVL